MLVENGTDLTVRQLDLLLEFEQPLAALYDDWLGRDTEEMSILRSSMESCADDQIKHRVEEQYAKPTQPMYEKSWADARACDEYPEWMANHRRSVDCAKEFQKGASIAYHERSFSEFLQKWQGKYGKERRMYVLACTMEQRQGDGRFYPPAKQAAAQFASRMQVDGDRTAHYCVDTHSCIVDGAMACFAKLENEKQQNTARKKNAQPER